jgi:hypothetical protein
MTQRRKFGELCIRAEKENRPGKMLGFSKIKEAERAISGEKGKNQEGKKA